MTIRFFVIHFLIFNLIPSLELGNEEDIPYFQCDPEICEWTKINGFTYEKINITTLPSPMPSLMPYPCLLSLPTLFQGQNQPQCLRLPVNIVFSFLKQGADCYCHIHIACKTKISNRPGIRASS